MFVWTFPTRQRHPLVRLLIGVVGVIVVLAALALGVFAAAALVVGGAIFMLVNALRAPRTPTHAPSNDGPRPPPPPGVIEGEFHVVDDARRDRQTAR